MVAVGVSGKPISTKTKKSGVIVVVVGRGWWRSVLVVSRFYEHKVSCCRSAGLVWRGRRRGKADRDRQGTAPPEGGN